MRKKSTIIFSAILLFFMSSALFGQGILRGVITDSSMNSVLIGANVYLKGTAMGASTNLEGQYKVTGIPVGNYTVKISYIGYKPKEVKLYVPSGETIFNIKLLADVIEGDEVIITAQARGQAAAINQQISSNTIVNVVSEERLQELPDVNAAEVIGRLPGVALQRSGGEANKVVLRGLSDKFSTITVDGIRLAPTDPDSRGVDLSTISQGSLAGIELFKALTPDKDADAIAGSVNLVTKKAPETRLLRIDAKGAYNKLNNTAEQYDFSLRYGERFFDNILGVQVTGNLEQRDRSNELMSLTYNTNANGLNTDWEINDFDLNYTNEIRKRQGVGLLLDIATPDQGVIRISNIYNKTNRDYIMYTRNYPTVGTIDLSYSARDIETDINTYNSSIQGENNLFGIKANWLLSFAQSQSENPYDYTISFSEPAVLENGQVVSRMQAIPKEIMKGPPETLIPYALNNFTKAYMNWGYFRTEKNIDKEKTASIDLSKNYNIFEKLSGELKIGGKYRYKNRSKQASELASSYYTDAFRTYVRMPDGTVQAKNFAGTRFSDLQLQNGKVLAVNFVGNTPEHRSIYNLYDLFPLLSRDALKEWYEFNKNGVGDMNGGDAEYKRNLEADADYYDIIERVGSGYIMNTFNFGQEVTFIAGVRIENESNDYQAKYSLGPLTGFPTPSGSILDTTATFSQSVLLPNFHLNIRPNDFLNVRVAAYKALARPDFNYRLNKAISRNSGSGIPGVPNVVSFNVGNPDLKTAEAWNFEINTSLFGNQVGLITVSAFYKEVKNMFHLANGISAVGNKLLDSLGINWKSPFLSGVQYALSYPYNSSKPTKVWGFEIEHQTNFVFLPGYLQYIVLNYNFSIVKSETYITTSSFVSQTLPYPPWQRVSISYDESKQKLEGQPEFFGNIALGYDIGGFSARISVFYQSEYTKLFSFDGRNDQVQGAFSRWDFVLKQKITDNISVLLNVNNFTSYVEEDFFKNRIVDWTLLDESQKYGLTADLGVRINF